MHSPGLANVFILIVLICSHINIRNKKIIFLKKCSYIQPWHSHMPDMDELELTVTKKMADVQFTRMHCDRKSFYRGN